MLTAAGYRNDRVNEHPLYFPALDGLRFIAFLLVFVRHLGDTGTVSGNFFWTYGWAGVDLFFCLTGFLFFVMLQREYAARGSINYKWFYIRRALRIMPLYAFYLFGALLYGVYAGVPDLWASFAAYATFTANLITAFFGVTWSLPRGSHLWTIGYEEQAYLVLPLAIAAIVGARGGYAKPVIVLLGCVVLAWAVRYVLDRGGMPPSNVYLVPFLRPDTIIAGVICGIAWVSGAYTRLPSWAYGLTALIMSAALFVYYLMFDVAGIQMTTGPESYILLSVFFSSVLLYALSDGSLLKKLLELPPFPWLGKISYGLYVWHFVALYAFRFVQPMNEWNYAAKFILALALNILIAAISYYLLERPFLRLKDRFQIVRNRPTSRASTETWRNGSPETATQTRLV